MIREYVLFTFDSTHSAIAAQRLLADLSPVLMPTLREISASCGMSLRLRSEDRGCAESRMAESGIGSWYLYRVIFEGKKPDCKLLCKAGDCNILKGKADDGHVR